MGPRVEPRLSPLRAEAVPDLDHLSEPQEPTGRACSTSPTTSSCSPARRSDGPSTPRPAAERVHGRVLLDACRYYEFRVDRPSTSATSATRSPPRHVHSGAHPRLLRIQPRPSMRWSRPRSSRPAIDISSARRDRCGAGKARDRCRKDGRTAEEARRSDSERSHQLGSPAVGSRVSVNRPPMTRPTIQTPSRLHFGLLAWGTSNRGSSAASA